MFTKALIVDIIIKIPDDYIHRIKKLFQDVGFVISTDQNFKKELSDTEAIFCNISTKIVNFILALHSVPKNL